VVDKAYCRRHEEGNRSRFRHVCFDFSEETVVLLQHARNL